MDEFRSPPDIPNDTAYDALEAPGRTIAIANTVKPKELREETGIS
jgi:hypothetical protein